MRRPEWWPAVLWPGGREEAASRDPEPGSPGAGTVAAGRGRPDDRRRRGGEPWPTFLDLLLESLGAASGAVWSRDGERWTVVSERRGEGWAAPERGEVPARGHPFSWSAREDLILQIPAERATEDAPGGWTVVVPDPGRRRLVELWFPSAPGPAVRETANAIQAHLAWLDGVRDREGGGG